MKQRVTSPLAGYGFALLSVAVAVGARFLLDPVLGHEYVFAPVLLAILVTAYYFGFRPALVAVFVGALACELILIEPRDRFELPRLEQQIGLVLYLAIGIGVARIAGVMHDAQQALLEANHTLESSVRERTAELSERNIQLGQSESRLRFVTSSARVGLVVLGPDYRYLFANEAYAQLYGLELEGIAGRTVPEVLPSAWPQIQPWLDRGLAGEAVEYELVVPSTTGASPRYFTVIYEPRQPNVHVVVVDITERKKAVEETLRLSEQVTLAARAARLGIWDWDLVENKIAWDDQMYSLYGRKRGDFGGEYEAWLASIHPEDQDHSHVDFQRACSGVADYESEFRIIWPDGSVRYLRAVGEVLRDETGRPVRMLGVDFDVTEARLASAALEESQSRLEAALTSMTDAVSISDLQGQCVHFNDAYATFHRFRGKAECAQYLSRFAEIIDVTLENGEPVPPERWAVPRALRGETVTNEEYLIRRRDTGEIWFGSYSFSPIRDTNGLVSGAVVVGRDITDRRQAARDAREREDRFKQLTDSIREVFWLTDIRKGRVLYVSPAYEAIWGRTCEALYVSPDDWLEAILEEDRPVVAAGFESQKAGEPYDIEYRIRRPDGTLRWIHDRAFPVRDAEGELYRVAGVAEDVTERHKAELASQQHQIRLEGIVNAAMDGIITMGEDQCVVLINKAAERIFGCRAEEAIGRPIERFLPERFRAAHANKVREYGETGVAARTMGTFGPVSGLRANGEEFPLEASISQIEVEGNKLFTVTCRDVTERLQAEEARRELETQLHQSQKMEAFGQLAGGIAHDFNNLLTIINGYSEWLLSSVPSDHELRPQLSEILKAGEHAATLTRQLLAFSRQQVIAPRVLSLNGVVEGVEKMLRRIIGEDVRLTTVLRPSAGFVRVDPGQIEQVIMNLAVNARDAMPQGGQLTIETDDVTLDETYVNAHAEAQPGHFCLLAISDTGVGMSREIQSRIFEPFFTTKSKGKGTGLGLAVVHGIVKQGGGSLAVYSEPGEGTTIKIYFPMVESVEISPNEEDIAPPQGGGETILLVEDEDSVRQMTAIALTALGYHVETASCGQEAIDRMAEISGRVDLLVSDVVMPQMSGRILAERLEERYPALKVLFVSGYTDDAVMRHGVLQSDVAFLQKPFTLNALARKVRQVLNA